MVKETISYKLVRRILKQYTQREVSRKGVLYVRDFLDDILRDISIDSAKELERINQLRQKVNLSEMKRIPQSIFKNLSHKHFKWELGE